MSLSANYKPPNPDDVHYTAKIDRPELTREGAQYWLREAHKALLYQLSEEVQAGDHDPSSDWWRAETHKRAVEMIEKDDQLRPGYKTILWQTIEDEALYHYAGYESVEEWFASSGKGGGQGHDERWWGKVLIPWCKMHGVFAKDTKGTLLGDDAEAFFWTPTNGNGGNSRHAPLRKATPTLRDIIERDVYELPEEEQVTMVRNILATVADPHKSTAQKTVEFDVKGNKVHLQACKNGTGMWHVTGELTDENFDRLRDALKYRGSVEIIENDNQTTDT